MNVWRLIAITGLVVMWQTPGFAGSPCQSGNNFGAVDISYPVKPSFLQRIKSIGVTTIIRYYDWENETLPGKTLSAHELSLIKKANLSVAVVFQHHNNSMETFETPNRGAIDAKRSLDLARKLGQPSNSTIYFGIDGVDDKFYSEYKKGRRGADDKFGINLIKKYFQDVNNSFRQSFYKIGVYGSGLVCQEVLDARLASFCWLANATSWPNYYVFLKSDRWSLRQLLPTKDCFGEEVDLNIVSNNVSNFGQWKP